MGGSASNEHTEHKNEVELFGGLGMNKRIIENNRDYSRINLFSTAVKKYYIGSSEEYSTYDDGDSSMLETLIYHSGALAAFIPSNVTQLMQTINKSKSHTQQSWQRQQQRGQQQRGQQQRGQQQRGQQGQQQQGQQQRGQQQRGQQQRGQQQRGQQQRGQQGQQGQQQQGQEPAWKTGQGEYDISRDRAQSVYSGGGVYTIPPGKKIECFSFTVEEKKRIDNTEVKVMFLTTNEIDVIQYIVTIVKIVRTMFALRLLNAHFPGVKLNGNPPHKLNIFCVFIDDIEPHLNEARGTALNIDNTGSGVSKSVKDYPSFLLAVRRSNHKRIIIHELIHLLGFDYWRDEFFNGTMKNSFETTAAAIEQYVHIRGVRNINEAYTDCITLIVNTAMFGTESFVDSLNIEYNFSLLQCAKILNYIGKNDVKDESKSEYSDTTNLVSYCILRASLLKNVEQVANLFKFGNVSKYLELIVRSIKNPEFNADIVYAIAKHNNEYIPYITKNREKFKQLADVKSA
jgi:hypothetical protein